MIGVEYEQVVGHDVGGIPLRKLNERLQPGRVHAVVAVHDGDPLAPRCGNSLVARRARTSPDVARDQPDAVIFLHHLPDDADTGIGRCIVRHDDLEIGQRLHAR